MDVVNFGFTFEFLNARLKGRTGIRRPLFTPRENYIGVTSPMERLSRGSDEGKMGWRCDERVSAVRRDCLAYYLFVDTRDAWSNGSREDDTPICRGN